MKGQNHIVPRTLSRNYSPTDLDVTEEASFRALLDAAADALEPLDILINNAGIMPIGPLLGEPADTAHRLFWGWAAPPPRHVPRLPRHQHGATTGGP